MLHFTCEAVRNQRKCFHFMNFNFLVASLRRRFSNVQIHIVNCSVRFGWKKF